MVNENVLEAERFSENCGQGKHFSLASGSKLFVFEMIETVCFGRDPHHQK